MRNIILDPWSSLVCTAWLVFLDLVNQIFRPWRVCYLYTDLLINVVHLHLTKKRINSRLTDIFRDRKSLIWVDRTQPDWWNWLSLKENPFKKLLCVELRFVWPGEMWQHFGTVCQAAEAFKWSWRGIWRSPTHSDRLRMFSPGLQRQRLPRFTERSQWSYLICWTLLLTQSDPVHL